MLTQLACKIILLVLDSHEQNTKSISTGVIFWQFSEVSYQQVSVFIFASVNKTCLSVTSLTPLPTKTKIVSFTFSNSGQSTICNLAGDPAVKFTLRKSENSRQAKHSSLLPSAQGLNRMPLTLIVNVLSYWEIKIKFYQEQKKGSIFFSFLLLLYFNIYAY